MNSAIKPIVDICLVSFLAGPQLPDQLLSGNITDKHLNLNCDNAVTVNYTWTFLDLQGNLLIPDEIGTINAGDLIPVLIIPGGSIYESFEACLYMQVYDVGDQLLEEVEHCIIHNFTAPDLTEAWFSISCDGHCFQILAYELMWQYTYTIDGMPFFLQDFYYSPYCMEEGTHVLEASDFNGCVDSFVFEAVGVMSDNNDDC